jgi:acyl carrier protein
MATLELLNFLEQEFQVQFEAYELTPEYMDTMSDIARLVQSKRG